MHNSFCQICMKFYGLLVFFVLLGLVDDTIQKANKFIQIPFPRQNHWNFLIS